MGLVGEPRSHVDDEEEEDMLCADESDTMEDELLEEVEEVAKLASAHGLDPAARALRLL